MPMRIFKCVLVENSVKDNAQIYYLMYHIKGKRAKPEKNYNDA